VRECVAAMPPHAHQEHGGAAHPKDDRPRQDGVGQPAEPRQCDSAVCRDLLGLYLFTNDNASPGDCSFAVPCIEQLSNLLVIFRLRAEHGVDFIKEDSRPSAVVRPLAE
jgi:hypothetical protein